MARKRPMGEASRDVLKTAGESKRKGWREALGEPAAPRPKGVMYMVERKHRDALQDAARRLRDEQGGSWRAGERREPGQGRADASLVLRALLDEWIADGGKLPKLTTGEK